MVKPEERELARVSVPEVASTALKRIVEERLAPGARITERWVVDVSGVTHSQARETLHHLDKAGAVVLSARRGATLVRHENVAPSDVRPIWLALLELAGRQALKAPNRSPSPPTAVAGHDLWGQFLGLQTQIDALGYASGNYRLHQRLRRLAIQAIVGWGKVEPIDPKAVEQYVQMILRAKFDEAALQATFASVPQRLPARREAINLPSASPVAITDAGRTARAARAYLHGVGARLESVRDAAPSTTEQLVAAIRQRIQFGELLPGDPIRELPLAEQYGISRGPVRDALRALDRHGLVSIEGRRGAFVRRLLPDDIANLFAIRAAVSGVQMSEAATAPDRPLWIDDALRKGAKLLDEIARDEKSPLGNYVVVRRALALVTLAAGGNIAVGRLAAELEGEVSILWATVFDKSRQIASARRWHYIVESIIARDADGAREHGRRIVEEAAAEALRAATRSDRPTFAAEGGAPA